MFVAARLLTKILDKCIDMSMKKNNVVLTIILKRKTSLKCLRVLCFQHEFFFEHFDMYHNLSSVLHVYSSRL